METSFKYRVSICFSLTLEGKMKQKDARSVSTTNFNLFFSAFGALGPNLSNVVKRGRLRTKANALFVILVPEAVPGIPKAQ